MPLRLETKKLLATRSDRVKCVDLHPTEPWVLCSLYTGHLMLYNYLTSNLIKTFEIGDQPIRSAKFIARKNWIVAGADDLYLRVFSIDSMEKIAEFDAHIDYIRAIEVHPTQPYLLTASDDMLAKCWSLDTWAPTQIYEGHSHYVMAIKINPTVRFVFPFLFHAQPPPPSHKSHARDLGPLALFLNKQTNKKPPTRPPG